MLEGMRRNGASVFIYIIFGILIAVFVINFGPQSQGGPGGCSENSSQSDTAITVAGEKVRAPTAFRAVYSFFKNNGAGDRDAKTSALEFLMRRELLAQSAEERGLVANEAMVEEEIKRGFIFIGGQRVPMHTVFFEKQDDASFFNYRGFEGFVGSLNVTRSTFMAEQVRELLAALEAESLKSSVLASRDEALAEFVYEGNTATYDVVAFSPRTYRDAFLVSEEDVARYLAAHGAEVEAKFKADERLYKGVKPQVRVRQIFVAKAKPAAPAPAAAAPAAGAAAPAAPAAAPAAPAAPAPAVLADAGKTKLEAARTEILAKKRTFVEVAKQLSSEAVERASGGDQGWRTKETPALPETALNDAVKTLKVGEVSEVITTENGFYLVTVQEERQGDLTLDQVKAEIAGDLAKDGWAKEAARRAAIAALDAAQKGVIKDLNKLYKPTARPSPGTRDIQQLLNDPSLTPEMKQQLLQQFLQQSGDKSGSLSYESENVPAAWTDDQAPAGGAAPAAGGAAPAAAGAAPAAGATAAPAAPAAGATAAPAAGAVDPAAAPAAPVELSAAELMKPSTEQLPEMAAVEPPNVERAGPTPRATRLPELGTSKLAAKAVFDDLAAGQLSQQIYEVDGSYVLVQLIERQQPKMEDFDKDADQRVRTLRDQRGQALVESWLKERCESLAKANRIKANPGLTREMDDQGKLGPSFYKPCMSFR